MAELLVSNWIIEFDFIRFPLEPMDEATEDLGIDLSLSEDSWNGFIVELVAYYLNS